MHLYDIQKIQCVHIPEEKVLYDIKNTEPYGKILTHWSLGDWNENYVSNFSANFSD